MVYPEPTDWGHGDNYRQLINYLGKQMSQGNASVSERLLWREEKRPEKLTGSAGWDRGSGKCKGQGAKGGGALGAGKGVKAEHVRGEMHRGAPPCSEIPTASS